MRTDVPSMISDGPDRINIGLVLSAGLEAMLVIFAWLLMQRGFIDTTDFGMAELVTFYLLKAQDVPVAIALSVLCLALLRFSPSVFRGSWASTRTLASTF